MKKILAFSVALLIFASSTVIYAEVHFKTITYAEALKLAAKEKKIVMIDFYTDWCGWCKRLDHNTYSSDELGKYADENIISIKVNADDNGGVGSAFSHKLGISGFPTIVFFDADGKEIHRVVGYKAAPDFMQDMMKAVDKNPKSSQGMMKDAEKNGKL